MGFRPRGTKNHDKVYTEEENWPACALGKVVGSQGQRSRVNYQGLTGGKGISVLEKLPLQGPKLMTASLERDEPACR